jgi:hypothetical protein
MTQETKAYKNIRFNKGDIIRSTINGDKYTVIEDTGGLFLFCHKSRGLSIVNNNNSYELICDECGDGSGWYGDDDIIYNCKRCNPQAI